MRALVLCLAAASLGLGAPALHAAKIVLVAGTPDAPLHEPFGAEPDGAGNLFIIEMISGNRLLKLDAKGVLTQIAGTGPTGEIGNRGTVGLTQFQGPHNLAVLPGGDILIADTWNGRIWRLDLKTDKVSKVNGYGVPRADAKKGGPYCIALNPAGTDLFVADLLRVQAINLAESQKEAPVEPYRARLIAGNGEKGKPADGAAATEAPLADPRAVAVDRQGNVYVLERGGHALRVVDPAGHIRTVVNGEGKKGATGDGGPGIAATMNGPKHICIDNDEGVLIADAENHLIRKYWPKDGTITRIAGTGKSGAAGVGGDPLQCEVNRPHGVSVDRKSGDIFVTDSYNNRVLKIVR